MQGPRVSEVRGMKEATGEHGYPGYKGEKGEKGECKPKTMEPITHRPLTEIASTTPLEVTTAKLQTIYHPISQLLTYQLLNNQLYLDIPTTEPANTNMPTTEPATTPSETCSG